jgi:hypothetical protein
VPTTGPWVSGRTLSRLDATTTMRVLPIMITAPASAARVPVMRAPSTKVPLLLASSRTSTERPSKRITACSRDTLVSSSETSTVAERPTRTSAPIGTTTTRGGRPVSSTRSLAVVALPGCVPSRTEVSVRRGSKMRAS